MGLDQYLYKTTDTDTIEVEYWRKNNQLQGWFEKNCNQENYVPTLLTEEIVTKLLEDIENGLEVTSGFFYGSHTMSEEEAEDLKDTFENVLKDIKENNAEYQYDCWY